MCSACQTFANPVELTSAAELDALLSRLYREGLSNGVLAVSEGSLAWSDGIECLLVCLSCGDRFLLNCETYHGLGGRFGPTA